MAGSGASLITVITRRPACGHVLGHVRHVRLCSPAMRAPRGTLLRAGMTIILCLAVASCTDEPDPGTIKSPSPTPTSSSASPTPSTPEAQIEAAVRAYYAELTRAAQTNDTSQLATMVTRGCPCHGAVRAINRAKSAGRTTPDAAWSVDSVRVHDIDGETGLADVEYTVSAYDVLNAKGKIIADYPEEKSRVDLSLVASDGKWIIGNLFDLEG